MSVSWTIQVCDAAVGVGISNVEYFHSYVIKSVEGKSENAKSFGFSNCSRYGSENKLVAVYPAGEKKQFFSPAERFMKLRGFVMKPLSFITK